MWVVSLEIARRKLHFYSMTNHPIMFTILLSVSTWHLYIQNNKLHTRDILKSCILLPCITMILEFLIAIAGLLSYWYITYVSKYNYWKQLGVPCLDRASQTRNNWDTFLKRRSHHEIKREEYNRYQTKNIQRKLYASFISIENVYYFLQ